MFRSALLLSVLVLISCQKDQDEPIVTQLTLHYDGANQSAPILARGISYAAVKFPSYLIQSSNLTGKKLASVDFYVSQRPDALKLLVFAWNATNPDLPGNLIYEAILNKVSSNSWNTHDLEASSEVIDDGFWVAFEIESGDRDLRVIGCDPGPRIPNGDMYGLFGDNNPGWTTFYDFSQQEVNINWNIRAQVK
jgi:hypothetical protein